MIRRVTEHHIFASLIIEIISQYGVNPLSFARLLRFAGMKVRFLLHPNQYPKFITPRRVLLIFLLISIGSHERSRKSPIKTQSKLQFDLKTIHTWINTTILNSTHAQDGNEIVLIKETPFRKFNDNPRLPTVVLYSMDTQKLQIGITEKQG